MNGYTRIPHELMRNPHLPPIAKVVWSLIAGMAPGFHATVAQFCKMVACHPNTWRSTIKLLVRCGMVSVERSANGVKYTAVTDTSKWKVEGNKNCNPNNNCEGNKNCKGKGNKNCNHEGNKISHPSEEHIEEQKNNNSSTTRACVRTRLIEEVKTDAQIERGCMALGIDRRTYLILAEQVFIDWDFQALPDSEWNTGHFLAVMRYKAADYKKQNNGTGQQTDGRADKDSTIAQLDRDTLTAMASLARKGQYIDKAPF